MIVSISKIINLSSRYVTICFIGSYVSYCLLIVIRNNGLQNDGKIEKVTFFHFF